MTNCDTKELFELYPIHAIHKEWTAMHYRLVRTMISPYCFRHFIEKKVSMSNQ
jgi:hypothetical protein